MILLLKIWGWVKKYWKWVLFPIGIISVLIAYFVGKSKQPVVTQSPDLGDAGNDAIDAAEAAVRERDRKLEELRLKNAERLQQLSADQTKELEELKSKPIEEVVAWFDRL